jgi:hypothetical protein
MIEDLLKSCVPICGEDYLIATYGTPTYEGHEMNFNCLINSRIPLGWKHFFESGEWRRHAVEPAGQEEGK